jgi:nucleoid-associated protein YgaU
MLKDLISSKKKDKESAKESTTETDSIDKEINKKTTTRTTKDSSKNSNKSNPKTSNKESQKSSDKLTCSLKIECKEILDGNIDKLSVPKRALVPKDGIIYDNASVTFEKGDTVWDVLSKEVKKNSILMEYSYVPVYKTNYIEGIAGLYEFDAGDTSGWRYMVNGQYPAYGCDKYKLNNNDQIVWHYTVKLD